MTRGELPAQLHQRPGATAGCRPARRPESKTRHQPCDPLSVEVPAGHGHDTAAAPVQRGRQDAPVPQRQDRRAPGTDQRVIVMRAVHPPGPRTAQRRNERVGRRGDCSGLHVAPGNTRKKCQNCQNCQDCQNQKNSQECLRCSADSPRGSRKRGYMPSYWGPPPPSGGTQSMTW